MFWLCLTNGAAGHTYGANGIWQLNRKGQPHGPSPTAKSPPTGYGVIAWDEAMHLPGSQQMAHGKKFFESLPWTQLTPMGTNIGWAEPPEDAKEDPLFAPQMCGIGDQLRVVYVLAPRAATVRALRASIRYSVTYFDPVTGRRRIAPPILANERGEVRIAPPTQEHDWVVLLKAVNSGKTIR
jgi:Protein of unknown function (DUF4038)